MSTRPLDVLVVGGTGVDTVVRVDALPVPYADSYLVPPVRDWVAHTGTTVALACHTLGLATRLIDFIGEDPQGEQVRAEFTRRGLDFGWLPNPAGTSRAVNLVGPDGRRLSFFDPRDPGRGLPREFYAEDLARARHVHATITGYALPLLDEAPGSTSTDLHDWDGANPYHRRFAERADLVFLSTAALGDAYPRVMREILGYGRATAVVATSGPDGCHILDADGMRHLPATPPPGPVVDTNGAGDSFVAAFLWARAQGLAVDECARAGLAGGAYACTSEGTAASFIDAAALRSTVGA